MSRSRSSALRLWGPVVILMAGIFVLSAQHELPSPPGGLSDKQAHAAVYAVLGALWYWALAGGQLEGLTAGRAIQALLYTAAYGVSDEIHQAFVPGRTSDLRDVLADAIGALLATGVLWACGIILARRRPRPSDVSP